jgi:hypothetical protein
VAGRPYSGALPPVTISKASPLALAPLKRRNNVDGRALVGPDPKRHFLAAERARPGNAAPYPLVLERVNVSLRVPRVRKPAKLAARGRVDGEVGGFGRFSFLCAFPLGSVAS